MNLENITGRVTEIVREAAAFIYRERQSFKQEVVEYKGFNDLVSYVDKEAENILVQNLRSLLPEADFITEENTAGKTGKDYSWVIDPLDGTTNFVHGLPCYCVSVGLLNNNEVILGVIYEINLKECFYAWKGGGAWLNGKKIHVSPEKDLKRALMATGFPYTNFTRLKEYMDVFDYCMKNTHGIRRLGSAAVDMAYVACGRFEGFYEYGLHAWDIAAGCCIIKEAGGRISDFSGNDNFLFGKEIISCNEGCFDAFLEVVKEKFRKKLN